MDIPDDIDRRLTELEIKASFTEDTLDQLNQVIVRQAAQVDALVREVRRLRDEAREKAEGPDVSPASRAPGEREGSEATEADADVDDVAARAAAERPPHY
jgi:SlyX protein